MRITLNFAEERSQLLKLILYAMQNIFQRFHLTFLFFLFIIIIHAGLLSGQTQDSGIKKQTKMDSISHAIGIIIGSNLQQNGLDKVEYDAFLEGVKAKLEGQVTPQDIEKANMLVSQYLGSKQAKQHEGKIEMGKKFFAENAKKEGVVSLPSGLQYKILKEGNGPIPKATDNVKVHYHGTLLDGTVFDSSVERGEPIDLPVNGVIKGWQEALQLMPVGSKWQLFIPYDLGYGERGAGGAIGPYEPLIFEVELLGINK